MWVKPLLPWGHPKTPKKPLLRVHQLFRSLDGAKQHYRANFKDVEKQKLVERTHKYIAPNYTMMMMMMYECMNYDLLTIKYIYI